jgi:hypothetical protein
VVPSFEVTVWSVRFVIVGVSQSAWWWSVARCQPANVRSSQACQAASTDGRSTGANT